ncbi:hypothetical protein LJR175_008338 [Variovorax sp. LjRoot175]|uniref:hypothetical protein n=1 Tax=Variovorax sp. LjRoot175 TaxID=3342276 RepID=UPI003ECEB9CC
MISVERLLTNLAVQNGVSFTAAGIPYGVTEVFGSLDFSFMPAVVAEAIRIARALSVGIESDFDMELVGAQLFPAEEGFEFNVTVRPLGDAVGVLRGLLFQQAADRVFGWNEEKLVDLMAVFKRFKEDGYEQERQSLESYTAALAARVEAHQPQTAMAE